jgi:5-methyltetrahydrofolate--homocysteine methyltransferase
LSDEVVGPSATSLFNDAQAMLKRVINEKWFSSHGIVGLYPANSVGDDVEIYADENRDRVIHTFRMLRQQSRKAQNKFNLCLADFVAPKSSGVADYMGTFAVTAGIGIDKIVANFEKNHDEYGSILAKALADRLVEAFAECLHQKVRKQVWGYQVTERLSNEELIQEKYQGIRPAPGYPACPDHTEKPGLFELLKVTQHTTMQLTENFAMLPAASVSGYYFSHPESQYFGVGKIGMDQVEDYAKRKGMDLSVLKRWLSPNLN